jgi:hypothetical protein
VAQQEEALADAARQAAQLSSQLEESQGKVRGGVGAQPGWVSQCSFAAACLHMLLLLWRPGTR